ncbi:MAG TPA: hypothetical protein VFW33_02000 [Gemmataceae bacterium]|nr:hypothetical protein [Gemmataceae bacterium]
MATPRESPAYEQVASDEELVPLDNGGVVLLKIIAVAEGTPRGKATPLTSRIRTAARTFLNAIRRGR